MKKGLEKLFRRVEREVSEEVLEVVWGDMQSCFMQQVARFNSLILKCYPGRPRPPSLTLTTSTLCADVGIALEFNEVDLAEYFKIIAEQR